MNVRTEGNVEMLLARVGKSSVRAAVKRRASSVSAISGPRVQLQLSDAPFFQPSDVPFAKGKVNHSPRPEPGDHSPRWKLDAVDQLPLPIHDVVDRPPVQVLRRPYPQIPLGVDTRCASDERRLVVGQLTRVYEGDLRELAAERIAGACRCRHRRVFTRRDSSATTCCARGW